jgi:hypothetical protein
LDHFIGFQETQIVLPQITEKVITALAADRFQVAHEVLALEILTLLLERPSDDSVEVTIAFLKECGQKLTEVSPRGIHAIFDRLRNVLHEANLDKRTQYMIEVMFQVKYCFFVLVQGFFYFKNNN